MHMATIYIPLLRTRPCAEEAICVADVRDADVTARVEHLIPTVRYPSQKATHDLAVDIDFAPLFF